LCYAIEFVDASSRLVTVTSILHILCLSNVPVPIFPFPVLFSHEHKFKQKHSASNQTRQRTQLYCHLRSVSQWTCFSGCRTCQITRRYSEVHYIRSNRSFFVSGAAKLRLGLHLSN